MYNHLYSDSVLQITSSDPNNANFGTGFVFLIRDKSIYVLTNAHIIEKIGGEENILVHQKKAYLEAISQKGFSEDIAILRTSHDFSFPIIPIPIGFIEQTGVSFYTAGWQPVDDNKIDLFERIELSGLLRTASQMKSGFQPYSVYCWQVDIDRKLQLQQGFGGAPIIERKSNVAIGVATDQSIQFGKHGKAISLKVLSSVWAELPSNIFRTRLYKLKELRDLLDIILNTDNKFTKFSEINFGYSIEVDVSRRVKIELLIIYCHYHNLIDLLLTTVQRENEDAFSLFYPSVLPGDQDFYNNLSYRKLWILYINKCLDFFTIRNKQTPIHHDEVRCAIKVNLNADTSKITNAIKTAFINIIADRIKTPRELVKIETIRTGSLVFITRMPSNSLDTLIRLIENNDQIVEDLKIESVIELLSNIYDIKRIEVLLNTCFSTSQLPNIAEKLFDTIQHEQSKFTRKATLVRTLIERCINEDKVEELLNIAFKHNSKVYHETGPFHLEGRRPFMNKSQRDKAKKKGLNSSQVTIKEILKVCLAGTATSFVGSLWVHVKLHGSAC